MAIANMGELVRRHRLQRIDSPSRGASAILHSVSLASFAYCFSYLICNPNAINDSYGWHLQYLTIIGLSLATATFAVGLLADITLSPTLYQIKNALSVASAPLECLISILYWGLRAIDPKLVMPDWLPPLPIATDLAFHVVPATTLAIDLLFFSPPQALTFFPALGLSGCIAFGYWFWIERCYHFNKFYPYPIFGMLDTTQRIALFGFSAFVMTLATAFLIWLYGVINGKEMNEFKNVANGSISKEQRNGNIKGE